MSELELKPMVFNLNLEYPHNSAFTCIQDINLQTDNVECYIKDKTDPEKFIYLGYLCYDNGEPSNKHNKIFNICVYNHYSGKKTYIMQFHTTNNRISNSDHIANILIDYYRKIDTNYSNIDFNDKSFYYRRINHPATVIINHSSYIQVMNNDEPGDGGSNRKKNTTRRRKTKRT
jgi:hypothetical protein